ncbi:AfsR/SARP family transcriptional regulator [Plantactinospora sp. KBS50]|uniref:AfsR/SARP family transcriptional regulator n=1 Tax=Plantactinospora sp. KBS50 TaxID=2024580 RepID=UPI0018DF61BF|nr:AfsR/SARP family transcriptional regulator [Plantactinospora sp. KBS50]
MLVIQVLGPTRFWRDGSEVGLGPPVRRAVLGLLVLAGGRPVSRSRIVDVLWGEHAPPSATNVIQTHVKHLRRLLEPDRRAYAPSRLLPSVGAGYALRVPDGVVDLDRFRGLLSAAAQAEVRDDPQGVATHLADALDMWHGPPFADVPALTGHPTVRSLLDERRRALARYADVMLALGRAERILPLLDEETAAHPLDEATQARLIRAQHALGRRVEALAAYDVARRHLADELGVGPGPDLVAAYLRVLDEAPAPPSAPPAGRAAPAPVNQLPAQVADFTGRAVELASLDGWAAAGAPDGAAAARIGIVCGTAGVGKTALAVRWAHHARDRFPDGLLHLDLRGFDPRCPVPPGTALGHLLESLGVPAAEIPDDLDRRATRYRAETTGRGLLVLLDNAASVDQVRPLIPGSGPSRVLITSRDSLAGLVALHGAHRIVLDLLAEQEALTLLRSLVGTRVDREPASAAALARQCAYLPLALRVAAELAAFRPAETLAGLVGELADQRRRLRSLDPGGDVRSAVRVVFSWSYRQLPPPAALLFRRLGLHPGPSFDVGAAAALAAAERADTARHLDLLARKHLVRAERPGRYVMHDLLRAYAAGLAAPDNPDAALHRLHAHLLGTTAVAVDQLYPADRAHRPAVDRAPGFPDPTAARAWLDAELPGLVATATAATVATTAATATTATTAATATTATTAATAAAGPEPGWHRYPIDLAATLYRHLEGGRHADAEALHGCALEAARHCGDPARYGGALTNVGAVHRLRGRYELAEAYLSEAVVVLGGCGDQLAAARALSNLGIVHERLGRRDAADRQRAALAAYRRAADRYGEASVLVNLGNANNRPGRLGQAYDQLSRSAVLFRETGAPVGEATALANLGDVCASLGRHDEAAGHLAAARDIFHAAGHVYGEAVALSNLGRMRGIRGDHARAVEDLTESIRVLRSIGHAYGEASALNNLGEVLTAMGRTADAVTRHAAALSIATATGDRDEQERAHEGIVRAQRAALRPAR